jgi:hypothetical protein
MSDVLCMVELAETGVADMVHERYERYVHACGWQVSPPISAAELHVGKLGWASLHCLGWLSSCTCVVGVQSPAVCVSWLLLCTGGEGAAGPLWHLFRTHHGMQLHHAGLLIPTRRVIRHMLRGPYSYSERCRAPYICKACAESMQDAARVWCSGPGCVSVV